MDVIELNQQVTDVDDALLDLPVKTWQDRQAVETAEELSSCMGPLTEEDTLRLEAASKVATDTMFGVIFSCAAMRVRISASSGQRYLVSRSVTPL